MNNTGKLILRVLAGVVELALISGILFATNTLTGNQISAMIANIQSSMIIIILSPLGEYKVFCVNGFYG